MPAKKTTSKRALSCWTNRNICHPKENQVWLILTRRVHVGNHERCCWVAARFCPPQSPPDPPCSVTVCCWGHLLTQWIQLSWDPGGSPLCTLKPMNKPWSGMPNCLASFFRFVIPPSQQSFSNPLLINFFRKIEGSKTYRKEKWQRTNRFILPSRTMHYWKGNPSKSPYICIVWSPQNG